MVQCSECQLMTTPTPDGRCQFCNNTVAPELAVKQGWIDTIPVNEDTFEQAMDVIRQHTIPQDDWEGYDVDRVMERFEQIDMSCRQEGRQPSAVERSTIFVIWQDLKGQGNLAELARRDILERVGKWL